MAHPTGKWAEAEIRRDDIKDLMEKTKKLATMYSELLAIKREGWENVLKAQLKREAKEKEKQNGLVSSITNSNGRVETSPNCEGGRYCINGRSRW